MIPRIFGVITRTPKVIDIVFIHKGIFVTQSLATSGVQSPSLPVVQGESNYFSCLNRYGSATFF